MILTPNLHAFIWNQASANNCNTYLIKTPEKNVLIDPGLAPFFEHVNRGLNELNMSIRDIDLVICTHAHPDHIDAIRLLDRATTLFAMHEKEWMIFKEEVSHYRSTVSGSLKSLSPDFFLTDGELKVGDIILNVFHTPGHTPGSVTLYWKDEGALITGDLIFAGGFGRTDFSGGDGDLIKDSIHRVAGLEAEWLLSGHGNLISGAEHVKKNFEVMKRILIQYI